MVLHIQEMVVVGFDGSPGVVGCGELPVLVEEILHTELMVAAVESCSVLEEAAENCNVLPVVVVSCNELAVVEESCNERPVEEESCNRLVVEVESCNERQVEVVVSTLCTVEVVVAVVQYKEVGEEGNRLEWVVESKLVLVGAVETNIDKLVGEVIAVVEVNEVAVSNVVVVVSYSSKV